MPEITVETPLGSIVLVEDEGAITRLEWRRGRDDETSLLRAARDQIRAYFAGDLKTFDLPLKPTGDAFQQSVCSALCRIPYGETREYGELARELDSMPQPVGNACGKNSIAIIIPCHRVVGAAGLGGFSAPGGIETKVALLRHEGAYGLLI